MKRKCQRCGNEFKVESTTPDQTYCTQICYQLDNSNRLNPGESLSDFIEDKTQKASSIKYKLTHYNNKTNTIFEKAYPSLNVAAMEACKLAKEEEEDGRTDFTVVDSLNPHVMEWTNIQGDSIKIEAQQTTSTLLAFNMNAYPLNYLQFKDDCIAVFVCYDVNVAMKLEDDIADSYWKHLCTFTDREGLFYVKFGTVKMELVER